MVEPVPSPSGDPAFSQVGCLHTGVREVEHAFASPSVEPSGELASCGWVLRAVLSCFVGRVVRLQAGLLLSRDLTSLAGRSVGSFRLEGNRSLEVLGGRLQCHGIGGVMQPRAVERRD